MDNPTIEISRRTLRVFAWFIDYFTIIGFFAILGVIIGLPNESDFSGGELMLAIVGCGVLAYFARDSFGGKSFGRWVVGIEVRDANDLTQTPSALRLFLRNLLLILWPIEAIALAASSKRQRLGDELLKTVVIVSPVQTRRLPRILSLLVAGLLLFVGIFSTVFYAIYSSVPYQLSIEAIQQNPEILEAVGSITNHGIHSGGYSIRNGEGRAEYQIWVQGSKGDVYVETWLVKQNGGKWELSGLQMVESFYENQFSIP